LYDLAQLCLGAYGRCRDRHGSRESSRDRDGRRDGRHKEWEGTPLRRGGEEEWEMTPGRDRGRSATPSGRSEWDFSASPALEPVRAGSRGESTLPCSLCLPLLLHQAWLLFLILAHKKADILVPRGIGQLQN